MRESDGNYADEGSPCLPAHRPHRAHLMTQGTPGPTSGDRLPVEGHVLESRWELGGGRRRKVSLPSEMPRRKGWWHRWGPNPHGQPENRRDPAGRPCVPCPRPSTAEWQRDHGLRPSWSWRTQPFTTLVSPGHLSRGGWSSGHDEGDRCCLSGSGRGQWGPEQLKVRH